MKSLCILITLSFSLGVFGGGSLLLFPGAGSLYFNADFSKYAFLGDAGFGQSASDSLAQMFSLYFDTFQGDYIRYSGFETYTGQFFFGGDYYVFVGDTTDSAASLQVHSTIRFDSSGWAVVLWEISNILGSEVSHKIGNFYADRILTTPVVAASSSGDQTFDRTDSWTVFTCGLGFASFAVSFGEYLDSQLSTIKDGDFALFWLNNIDFPANQDAQSILAVFGVSDPTQETSTEFIDRTTDLLADGNALLNYITPSGHNLLGHLSPTQLSTVVNWNLQPGGVGGDPHGRHFDGTHFEFPHVNAVYCLYHDGDLQVNIRVHGNYVKEVIAFEKLNGWTVHARLGETPEYLLNDELVEIPTSLFDGKIKTLSEIPRHSDVLGELSRYHENAFVMRNRITIIGGDHPQTGGFFNVQVKQRSTQVSFPSILQLHGHPGIRGSEDELSASVLPDLWFLA